MRFRSKVRRRLAKAFLDVNGWRVEGVVPDVRKAVFVAAPHTSNWDAAYMLAAVWALGIDVKWIGKDELFVPPLGFAMRATGGLPVNRRDGHDQVQAIARLFDAQDELFLGILPEGTRGKAKRWKSGFYWIAVSAKVPIVLGFVDYKKKRAGLGPTVWPTGDIDADFAQVKAFYAGLQGKHPERQGDVSLHEEGER